MTIRSLGLTKEEERCRWLCFYRKTFQNTEKNTANLISRKCCWFFAEQGRQCLSDRTHAVRSAPGPPGPNACVYTAVKPEPPSARSHQSERRASKMESTSSDPTACHKQETETNKTQPRTRSRFYFPSELRPGGPGCPQHRPGTPWPWGGQWRSSCNVQPRREWDSGRWGMRTTVPPREKTPNTVSA